MGVLAVTSADRLHAGWSTSQRLRSRGVESRSVVETLLQDVPRNCRVVTVMDGHPHTLSWLGGVAGHRVLPMGVEAFGQTGTIGDLYRLLEIDSAAIVDRAAAFTTGRPACPI